MTNGNDGAYYRKWISLFNVHVLLLLLNLVPTYHRYLRRTDEWNKSNSSVRPRECSELAWRRWRTIGTHAGQTNEINFIQFVCPLSMQ